MKKLLILLVVAILAFTTVAMAGCGTPPEINTSAESSSDESSTSTGKVSRKSGLPSVSISATGTNTTSGTSQVSGPIVSGSTVTVTSVDTTDTGAVGLAIKAINRIGTISAGNYKEKAELITNARNKCDAVADKSQIPNYSSLQAAESAIQGYIDQGTVLDFTTAYNNLPTIENLKNAHVASVYSIRDTMLAKDSLLASSIADYATMKTTITALYDKIRASLVEATCIAQDTNGNGIIESSIIIGGKEKSEIYNASNQAGKRSDNGSDGFTFSGSIEDGSEDKTITYSDKKNTNVVLRRDFKGTCTYTASCPGTLTVYVKPGNSRVYQASLNGTPVGDPFTSGDSANTCIYTVDITAGGTITVTAAGGTGYYMAVTFSYPNLG